MGVMRYQPQGALRPANNPYGQRLIAAATPADNLLGVARKSSTITGGPLGVYTPGGSGSYLQSVRPAPVFLGRQGGASPDNANLSFVIVATNIAANTWFYDGQEAGGQGAKLQTDGSNNLAWFDGTKQQITGVAIPAGARVICISGGAYNGVAPKVWFDGALGFTGTTDTSGHWNPTPVFRSLFGSGAFPGSNVFNGKGYMIAVLRGLLTDADALALAANPWQIFDGQEDDDLVAASAASLLVTPAGGLSFGATSAAIRSRLSVSAGGMQLAGAGNATRVRAALPAAGMVMSGVGLVSRGAARSPQASMVISAASPQVRAGMRTSSAGLTLASSASTIRAARRLSSGGVVIVGAASVGTGGVMQLTVTPAGGLALGVGAAVRRGIGRVGIAGVQLLGGALARRGAARSAAGGLAVAGSSQSLRRALRSGAAQMQIGSATVVISAGALHALLPNAKRTYRGRSRMRLYVGPQRVRKI